MGDDQPTALTYNFLVLDTIQKMRDAQAAGDKDKYFVYFDYAMGFAIHHLDTDTRRKIEDARKLFAKEVRKIKEGSMHDDEKRKDMQALKEDFANNHRYYVMLTLSKIGIVKVMDEGVIDFNELDIEGLKRVVRSDRGLEAAMDANIKKGVPDVQGH